MKRLSLLGMLLASLFNVAHAADEAEPAMDNADFCLFSGTPPSDFTFTKVKDIKTSKGAYGGVRDILPTFVTEAKVAGADAVINYGGSQRFGFFPWRLVRPVVHGTAIKWTGKGPVDCQKLGGKTFQMVMTENKAPDNASPPDKTPEK